MTLAKEKEQDGMMLAKVVMKPIRTKMLLV